MEKMYRNASEIIGIPAKQRTVLAVAYGFNIFPLIFYCILNQ